MTLLGHRNPLLRLSRAVRGYFRPARSGRSERRIFVVGHRGAARHAPENTITSFTKAIELGADAVETDVCVTRDGRFVLWHDRAPTEKVAVARQAGEEPYLYEPDVPAVGSPWRRPVHELDLADFRAHYGYVPRRGGAGRGERVGIALLEDLFPWASRERKLALVCLDVKIDPRQPERARDLVRFVREAGRDGRLPAALKVALLCPEEEVVRALLSETPREPPGPGLQIFADFELPGALRFANRLGARCVSLGTRRRFWSDFRDEVAAVVATRDSGRIESVIAWTISDGKRLSELAAIGVDGILTDDSKLLRTIAGEPARSR